MGDWGDHICLSIIAADDPVTCAEYAKENDLLAVKGWCRFSNLPREATQEKENLKIHPEKVKKKEKEE